MHASISAAKNDGLDLEAYAARAGNLFERKIAEVFTEYQSRLLRAGAMDFDDLLGQPVRLFREHPDVLQHYQRRFKHVLVDEYQDTNRVQNDFVLLLAADHRNVAVVGDRISACPPAPRSQRRADPAPSSRWPRATRSSAWVRPGRGWPTGCASSGPATTRGGCTRSTPVAVR